MRLMVMAVLLMGVWSHGCAEDGSADPASAEAVQIYHLKDGTKLIGTYDEKTHIFSTYNPETMEKTGIRGVDPSEVASHKPLAPHKDPVHVVAATNLPGMQGDWLDDYDAAVASATASGRPILIDFTGSDWCPWCIKLHDEIFRTTEFTDWASSNVVLMIADFPHQLPQSDAVRTQNQDLQAKYHIRGYPTVLVLDSSGKVLGQSGYKDLGAKGWIADLCQLAHLPSN
jgi:thiol-disulfide isomerase/thioredoxin